ncbi:hypothetical protein GTS_47750 [Gandjariella thermophila]|uniref:Beta-ketoacyl-[acyl-carrier-protein] synthase III C-terminal domain-containing protein n=2 Tax=Gandjariella thermophila TaxID=1931992 RepID=A0A4D4JCN9_9PSEU|nr:hypothetical protein GTS_47750 [Gandjariella thermophila]
MEPFAKASREKIHAVLLAGLRDADLRPGDRRLRYVLTPRLGRKVLRDAYLPAIAELTPAEVLDLGADTGHLGAGDAVANLAALHEDRLLRPGEYALVLNAGAGFTWSCLVVGAGD